MPAGAHVNDKSVKETKKADVTSLRVTRIVIIDGGASDGHQLEDHVHEDVAHLGTARGSYMPYACPPTHNGQKTRVVMEHERRVRSAGSMQFVYNTFHQWMRSAAVHPF